MRPWILLVGFAVLVLTMKSAWQMTGDFLLVAVLFLGFSEAKVGRGLGITLLMGFLLDVISFAPMGTALFSFGLTFGLVRFIKNKILFRSLLSQWVWIFVLTLINGVLAWIWMSCFGDWPRPWAFYLKHLLWSALVNGLLGLFLFPFLRWYTQLTWGQIVVRRDPLLKR